MTERSTRSSGKPSLNEQSQENFADNEGWIAWRNLTTEAMRRFHEQLLANVSRAPGLVGYEAAERARAANGSVAWSWGAAAEIQETINTINSWGTHLHDWCAWNAVVHSFAPRFMVGQIMRAFRSIEPWQELVEQPGGGSLLVDHPTKKCVSYTMCVLEPFPLRDACSASLSEYQKVVAAMSAFSQLLEEVCDSMDAIPDRLSGQS